MTCCSILTTVLAAKVDTAVRDRDLRRQPGVRGDQLLVRAERRAAASLVQPREDERRHLLPADTLRGCVAHGLGDQWLDVETFVRRPRDEKASAVEAPVRPGHARSFVR